MSEGMFLGRKFTIPYDTTTDQQVSSIARAQIVTRTASPGAVIQVGDTVMTYGVTPQQAKMGDLDIRLRSFEQISNQAQDAVRRNIQWQYGEQVGEADPMKKGFLAQLFGVPHLSRPFEVLYPPVKPGAKPAAAAVPAPNPAAPTPAKATAKPAATPAATPSATPAAPPAAKQSKKKAAKAPKSIETTNPASGQVDIVTPGDARHPDSALAPSPFASPKKAVRDAAATEPFGRGIPAPAEADLLTSFYALANRHKKARGEGWDMGTTLSGMTARTHATHGPSKAHEYHEISYDPESKGFVHRFKGALMDKPVETKLASSNALYDHIQSDNDQWAF